jgi:ribosomal protein S18 acetylase RimI-like enzyme
MIYRKDMMIQIQDWESSQKIIITDEINHGTVQVEIPKPGPYKDEYYQYADCAIYNLWVDEKYRKRGTARLLMETAEREAKKLGCKLVQLEWNDKDTEVFVLEWYKRLGYHVKALNENDRLLLVKEI